MTKHILYLSYDGMTDPLGQSQVLPYLTGLAAKGYRISLISFEKAQAFTTFADNIHAICEHSKIDWFPLTYTKFPPVISTMYDIQRMKSQARIIHGRSPVDLVHCRSYISASAGLYLKGQFGIPFIFDMRGFWPDERVDGKLWDLNNPLYLLIYKFFKKQESRFLGAASHTICLTDAARKEIHSWNHIPNNPIPITVIPCCVDMNHFDPVKIDVDLLENLRFQLGISPTNRVLSYIGSIGTWYMPHEMLDYYQTALEADPGLLFLIITRDNPKLIYTAASQKNIPLEKIIVKAGNRTEMPLLISLSDYSIFFILPVYSKIASSPTKQGEIMRLGIPIVCNDRIGDTTEIIEKYQAGSIIKVFNKADYQKTSQYMVENKFDKKRIEEGALEFYDLEKGVVQYDRVYQTLLKVV